MRDFCRDKNKMYYVIIFVLHIERSEVRSFYPSTVNIYVEPHALCTVVHIHFLCIHFCVIVQIEFEKMANVE